MMSKTLKRQKVFIWKLIIFSPQTPKKEFECKFCFARYIKELFLTSPLLPIVGYLHRQRLSFKSMTEKPHYIWRKTLSLTLIMMPFRYNLLRPQSLFAQTLLFKCATILGNMFLIKQINCFKIISFYPFAWQYFSEERSNARLILSNALFN